VRAIAGGKSIDDVLPLAPKGTCAPLPLRLALILYTPGKKKKIDQGRTRHSDLVTASMLDPTGGFFILATAKVCTP
jgi:hypothetical protein